MHKVSTPRSPCAPHAACKKAVEGLHSGRQVRHATFTNKTRVEVYQDTHAQLQVPVSACLAVATALALHCPHALADGPSIAQASHSHPSSQDVARKNYSAADTDQVLVARGLADGPELMYTSQAGQAPGRVVTGLADSAATSEMLGPPDSMATGTYVPGPIEVGWQIYVGSAVAAFPFFLGAYEFGKRILIQQRCVTRSWTPPLSATRCPLSSALPRIALLPARPGRTVHTPTGLDGNIRCR